MAQRTGQLRTGMWQCPVAAILRTGSK